jgi:Second Messenger Oligonucleotide or Dinucleotide Synthetase domain
LFITNSFSTQLDDLLARICAKLQISPTQFRLAETRYHTIGDWLAADGSQLAIYKPAIYSQGSLRIGTTVKPLVAQEYDLDLVCEIKTSHLLFPNPVDLLNLVEARLRQHETYKHMLERKNRCIRVNYAKEFHLDILPACPDPASGATCVVVPDRSARCWKHSNPRGYARWFDGVAEEIQVKAIRFAEPLPDQVAAEDMVVLKLTVQLLKRWRDLAFAHNLDVAPISTVLTTLAGNFYRRQDSVNDALTGILEGIVSSIPAQGRLQVCNPSNPKEDLSERWDRHPEAYHAFVSGITQFAAQWRKLNAQRGIAQIASFLEQLFGESLAKNVIGEQAQFMEAERKAGRLAVAAAAGGIVSAGTPNSTPIRRNTFYGS